MDRLGRVVEEKGFRMRRFQERQRLVAENVGHVAGGLHLAAVDIQFGVKTRTLSLEANPSIETWTPRGVVSHMPFPHESGLITGTLERLGEGDECVAGRAAI